MKELLSALLAMGLLCSTEAARADLIPPEVDACRNLDAGATCVTEDSGAKGICTKSTCSRLDYSKGSPPVGTVEYECLKCTPGLAGTGGASSVNTSGQGGAVQNSSGQGGAISGSTTSAAAAGGDGSSSSSKPTGVGGAGKSSSAKGSENGGAEQVTSAGSTAVSVAGASSQSDTSKTDSDGSSGCRMAIGTTKSGFGFPILLGAAFVGLARLRRKRA